MEMLISGQYGNKKLTVISGHDTTIAPILSFINYTSAECIRKKEKGQPYEGNCA